MHRLVVIALLLCSTATAQVGPIARPVSAVPISPAAKAAVDAWNAKTAPLKARFAAIRPDMPVAEALAERVALEQGMRDALPSWARLGLSDADRNAAMIGVWSQMMAIDAANTAWLKSVLPADGWFRKSRDGDLATNQAFLIVQHSPDQAFMRRVLATMEPLARAGEVRGADFVRLYDRTEQQAGRLQYYGSQFTCRAGRLIPDPVRDPDGVDARRKAMGLDTVAERARAIGDGRGGC